MKKTHRIIAIILVLSLLTNVFPWRECVVAFAGTMSMPQSLEVIGSSAFEGDTSLDTVELPAGMIQIRSRAFANSSLTSISIPSTVSFIAADAFLGTNTVIRSVASCYAAEYAQAHNIPWEEIPQEDTVDPSLQTMLSADVSIDTIGIDPDIAADIVIPGATAEEQAEVDAFNAQYMVPLRDSVSDYNTAAQDMTAALTEAVDVVGDASLRESSTEVFWSVPGMSITIDKGLSGISAGSSTITGMNTSADGQAIELTMSSGSCTYYFYISGQHITISQHSVLGRSKGTANGTDLVSRAAVLDNIIATL